MEIIGPSGLTITIVFLKRCGMHLKFPSEPLCLLLWITAIVILGQESFVQWEVLTEEKHLVES